MNFLPALVDESHPLELKGELPPAILGLEGASAKAEQPIQAELLVEKDGENFMVTGWLQTPLSLLCGRCALWFPFPVRARVEHLFEGPHPNSIA